MGFIGFINSKGKRTGIVIGDEKEQRSALPLNADAESLKTVFSGLFSETNSGVNVTADAAMGLSAVFSSVRCISEDLAGTSIDVIKTEKTGSRNTFNQHPVYKLIHDKPNHYQTPFVFFDNLLAITNLLGNGIAQIHRDGLYRPAELEIIHPDRLNGFELIDRKLYYVLRGENKVLSSDDVIHIAGPGWDGIAGKSMIRYHRENIGSGLAAQNFAADFYKNGAAVNGILSTDANLKKEQLQFALNEWNKQYSGVGNQRKTAALANGFKYQAISMPLEDAQFIETRKYNRSEIAGIYRVPPHMIGDMQDATFSNIEHQSINYVKHTLRPWAKRVEQELTRKLLTETEKTNTSIKFNLDSLMRGDSKARMELYTGLSNAGAISPNEIRELENLNAYEGGDDRFIQLNQIPVSMMKQYIQSLIDSKNTNGDGNTNTEE